MNERRVTLAAVALILGTLLIPMTLRRAKDLETSPLSGEARLQSITDTPTPATATGTPELWPDPIFTASEAEDRTMKLLPTSATTTEVLIRLISHETLADVLGDGGPDPGWHEDHPVWLVGILATDLTAGSMAEASKNAVLGSLNSNTTQLEGIYYAWDANSGRRVAYGGIANAISVITRDVIAELENETITVVQGTMPAQ